MTDSNANTSGLEPCPFCGGEAEQFEMSGRSGIRCADIMCAGSHRLPSEGEDHVAAWNRRVTAASAQAAIDALAADRDEWRGWYRKACDEIAAEKARADRLAKFGQHTNWELSHGYPDGEEKDGCWLVHSVNGGRNDREWTVIGRGETPDDAIRAALQQETQP